MIYTLWRIASSAGYGYFTNRLSTSAAAMAFYTMFALGPIMIFSIAVAEPFVGKLMAQEAIFKALETVVAPDQLKGIQRFATQDLFRGGGIAALIGAGVLLYTGTRVFVELDDGIDAIWRDRKTRSLHPVLAGGHQEHERRPGTENVAAIAGFGVAARLAAAEQAATTERLRLLSSRLERRLLVNCTHNTVIRLLPAMNLTEEQALEGCDILADVIRKLPRQA